MHNNILYVTTLLFIVFLTCCFSAETQDGYSKNENIDPQSRTDSSKSDSIQYIIREVVNDYQVPGIIAAIISGEDVIGIASAGERKVGSGIAITINDMVHLGSCTKAMTATMIATLVAEGKLSWDAKLIEVIPELKNKIHEDYHKITLWQLLIHQAGLTKNATDWGAYQQKEIKERRMAILEDNLKSPATYEMDQFHYSNLGYMIAACMAEQITGLSWEVLIKNRLFDPLGMLSVGFGAPNTHNKIDQPWGHSKSWSGNNWKPDQSDNSEALGPAGLVHCSIEDWAKFLSLQLSKENSILDRVYLNKLIEPPANSYYAGGWGVANQPWASGIMLTHSGSNGIWYTTVVVTPEFNRAFIVSTNSCDFSVSPDMCTDVINRLIIMELDLDNK